MISAAAAVRAGRIPDASVVLAAFDADCGDDGPIALLRLEPGEVLSRAVDLVQQQGLRTLDAIHVAATLSVARHVAVDDVEFVARDNGQAITAAALGLTVR